ncbi:MAG TPA: RHS repeat-associated core domain-containing protein, partial [Terriglobia bacterium]|nr:RHS repeat-associated core domain-containing protein [Terriglobia bacterium]
NTYNYDSFGNQTASTGSVSNRFFFTARESVAKTGLYYYRARYYDPTAGRFLSEDPLRSSNGTIDLYQYAENNPISFEDPTGLEACRKPAQCFAQLKYRPVNDWRAKIAGATHAFWYVQGSDGKQYILSSGPTGASGNGSLNVWRNSNVNNGADNTSATTWWNSGISSVNCAGVDKMIQAATRWPENQIPYSWSGPNSNSAAHDLGTIGGFNPPAPPGSVGWGAPIPKSH